MKFKRKAFKDDMKYITTVSCKIIVMIMMSLVIVLVPYYLGTNIASYLCDTGFFDSFHSSCYDTGYILINHWVLGLFTCFIMFLIVGGIIFLFSRWFE